MNLKSQISNFKSPSLLLVAAVWLGVRLVYNSLRQLVPDEAYYWVWSRHLQSGYLDHPPMVACVIRMGTALFGTNEFGVRSGAALLIAGAILIMLGLTKRMCGDHRAVVLAAGILFFSPFTAVLGTIITPDTPACFFSVAALAAAIAACERGIWWPVFGLFMGLAMDSKYTCVLLGASVAAAVFSTVAGRRQLPRPWIWIGLLVSLAVFLPVVLWNLGHDWASFQFQWHHGAGVEVDPSPPIVNLCLYVVGQGAIYTPVLFVLGLIAMAWQWRRWGTLATANRIVLLSATTPLVFFEFFALRHRPEANWPVFAYFPMTLILVQWLSAGWDAARVKWTHIGIGVAAVALVIGHLPEIMLLVPDRLVRNIPNPWEEMFGWRDYGKALDARSDGAAVYATSYENAAEASFYMKDHPQVWTIDASRPTAYDFFAGRPDPASLDTLLCVTRASAQPDIPDALRSFTRLNVEPWQTAALGRAVRKRDFILARR